MSRHLASAGTALTAGIHLPQAGSAASADSLREAAVLAEQLGFAAAWVSDHVVVQKGSVYPPSAYIFEPIVSLTWAAAATSVIELGTTVLVLPMRRPVIMAKMLSSLGILSNGRLIVGGAGGYVVPEFATLGVPMDERGPRTDEAIEIMRAMWTDDPITGDYPVHGVTFDQMRAKPQPGRRIPIWIGGHSGPALRRATRLGDGWHGILAAPRGAEFGDLVAQVTTVREARPESEYVLSVRVPWDGLEDDHDEILGWIDKLRELGITHILAEPRQRTKDDFLRSIDGLAEVFDRAGVLQPL